MVVPHRATPVTSAATDASYDFKTSYLPVASTHHLSLSNTRLEKNRGLKKPEAKSKIPCGFTIDSTTTNTSLVLTIVKKTN